MITAVRVQPLTPESWRRVKYIVAEGRNVEPGGTVGDITLPCDCPYPHAPAGVIYSRMGRRELFLWCDRSLVWAIGNLGLARCSVKP